MEGQTHSPALSHRVDTEKTRAQARHGPRLLFLTPELILLPKIFFGPIDTGVTLTP